MCYLVHGKVVYIGHGNGDRKIGDRLSADAKTGAQVYVVYSIDPRSTKSKQAISRRGSSTGSSLQGSRSRTKTVRSAAACRRMPASNNSELLFGITGFRLLEVAGYGASQGFRGLPGTSILRDVVPVEPDQMPAPPTERYRPNYRGLAAEGFYAGKKTFYIQPGADFAVGERRGMTAHNKARRKGLVKFLDAVSGADNRMRVRAGLRCLSAPIAARF